MRILVWAVLLVGFARELVVARRLVMAGRRLLALERDLRGGALAPNKLVIMLPMYDEGAIVADAARYFLRVVPAGSEIVFATSARETGLPSGTVVILERVLESLGRPPNAAQIVCPAAHRSKAAQLRHALSVYAQTHDTHHCLLVVYDADSRPRPESLCWLLREGRAANYVAQQIPRYSKNPANPTAWGEAESGLQNAFFWAWEMPAFLQSQSRHPTGGASGMLGRPTNLIGHGMIISFDVLERIGHFPFQSDDSAMGHALGILGYPIHVLPFFDECTVPGSLAELVRQKANWYRGVFSIRGDLQQVLDRFGWDGRRSLFLSMCAHRWAKNVSWIINPFVFLGATIISIAVVPTAAVMFALLFVTYAWGRNSSLELCLWSRVDARATHLRSLVAPGRVLLILVGTFGARMAHALGALLYCLKSSGARLRGAEVEVHKTSRQA